MKAKKILLIVTILIINLNFVFADAPDHNQWDALLRKHVSKDGMVNYKGIKSDINELNAYLETLQQRLPGDSWSDNEKLTYWINLYNANTVALIVRHYPVKSIMDIDKAWDNPFIKLGKETYSLNDIEHKIIRKRFDESRIHFVLVCAAISCPILLNEAYKATILEKQLHQQTQNFITDNSKNEIQESKAIVSQLFNWYPEDFTKKGSIADYINQYSKIKLNEDTKIEFMDYDWSLNE